jgi:hypothetical protein
MSVRAKRPYIFLTTATDRVEKEIASLIDLTGKARQLAHNNGDNYLTKKTTAGLAQSAGI